MSQRWRHILRTRLVGMLLAVVLALAGGAALAQSGAVTLPWWTADGGGATGLTAGGLTLSGTLGQPDASDALSAGGLTLQGGFWQAADGPQPRVMYLPITARSP